MKNIPKTKYPESEIDPSMEESKKRVKDFMKKFLKENGDLMKKLAYE